MKTSLNELKTADMYLQNKLSFSEMLAFGERLKNDPGARLELHVLKKIIMLTKLFRRRERKKEIGKIQARMLSGNQYIDFQEKIHQIFKS